MATTQGAPPSNVSPNSMYAVKAMKADAIRNRSARRILHFRGGVSDRGRPKLDFSKFHIIRFALIRQNTANATRIMKRMAGYISRILTQAIEILPPADRTEFVAKVISAPGLGGVQLGRNTYL